MIVCDPKNSEGEGPVRVLLVDDSATFRRVAGHFLEQQEGLRVVGALSGGQAALDQVKILRPQVVLVDLEMPGLSALETIRRLRDSYPRLGIIALTLLEASAYRGASLGAGADDFVSKYTMGAELLPVIREVAHRRLPGLDLSPAIDREDNGRCSHARAE